MIVSLRPLLVLILAHGVYLLLGGSLRQAALPILLGLLLLLALALAWRPARRALESSVPPLSRLDWVLVALAAALPVVAGRLTPRLVVWTIGGGAGLAIAWTILCLVLVRRNDADTRRPLVRAAFFIASWLVWISILWDVGLGQLVAEGVRPPGFVYDRLNDAIFPIWNERPISAHWFVGMYTPADFDAGRVYTGHSAPVLMVWYLISLCAQLLGLPLSPATLAIPFVYSILLVLAIYCLLSFTPGIRLRDRVNDYLAVFLLLGTLVTMASFWHSFLEHNSDNAFPLAVYLVVALCPLVLRGATHEPVFWSLALLLAVLMPMFALPLAISCWFVLSPEERAATSRRGAALFAGVALLSLAYPKIVAALLGYTDMASGLQFRSGLDGDTTYFTHAVQAVLAPRGEERNWWDLVYPTFVPVVLLLLLAKSALGSARAILGRMATVLLFPYAFVVILFPQAVSIHPYLFDYLLQAPVLAIVAATVLTPALRSRLQGPLLLLALSVAMTIIMAHLIWIAQFARLSLAAVQ